MLAQAAVEGDAQVFLFAGLGENSRHGRNEPGVVALHELEGADGPALAERGGQRVEDAALLGRREFEQNGGEARFFLDDHALESEVGLGTAQLRFGLDQFVASDDEFEGEGGIEPLVAARGFLDRVDQRLQFFFRALEFVMELDDLIERSRLFLGLARLAENGQELVGTGDGRVAQLDRKSVV